MSLMRDRMLGGVSFGALYAPADAAGAGVAAGGAADAGASGNDAGGAGDAGAAAGAAAAGAKPAAGAAADAGAGNADGGAVASKAAAPGAAGSLASGAAADAGANAASGAAKDVAGWLGTAPQDWREQLAGEDKGFLNQLKRHTTPQSAFDWLRKTSLKLSAGELKEVKAAPGKDATDEERATWRKEQGLPDKTEGYVSSLKLPEGVVLGEADKPLVDSFAARALKGGMPTETFNEAVSWYYETQAQQAQQREIADNDLRIQSQQRLISEMGGDFKPNMNVLQSFWNEHGGGDVTGPAGKSTIADTILTARTADGRILGDIPEVAAFYSKIGRELNPAATLLPAGGSQDIKGLQTRKAEIEKTMYINGKQNPAYFGNEAVQKEYREIIDAESKLVKRAS